MINFSPMVRTNGARGSSKLRSHVTGITEHEPAMLTLNMGSFDGQVNIGFI